MNQQNNGQAVLPRRSRRLATIISASHWISIGYTEDDARLMEELQNNIKKYCDESDDSIIKLSGRVTGILTRNDMLAHHDMMLPHWQKLFKALNDRRTTVDGVKLYGIGLPRPLLNIMFPAFQSLNLKDLMLCGTGLGNDGYMKLASFLLENTSLEHLSIGDDKLDDISVASALSDVMQNHPTLRRVLFDNAGLVDNNNNTAILEKILEGCTNIVGLGLIDKFGAASVTVLAEFICSNHSTRNLFLQGLERNKITDTDTLLLASALNTNANLRQLDMSENGITEEGDKILLNVMYDPTSMNSIVESNHICMAYTYDASKPAIVAQRPPLEKEVVLINNNDDISIQQKIRKKVVLALCGFDGKLFDLAHFNDLPVQLMPRILELIQGHTRIRMKTANVCLEKDALSRLFHTLRGWELPLLFENLGRSAAKNGTTRKRRKTRR